jgi:hypothetical protein
MIDKIIDGIVVGFAYILAILFVILIIGALLSIILVPVYFAEKKSCKEIAKRFNYKYEHTFFTGCVLEKPNGNKFLLKKLYNIEEN